MTATLLARTVDALATSLLRLCSCIACTTAPFSAICITYSTFERRPRTATGVFCWLENAPVRALLLLATMCGGVCTAGTLTVWQVNTGRDTVVPWLPRVCHELHFLLRWTDRIREEFLQYGRFGTAQTPNGTLLKLRRPICIRTAGECTFAAPRRTELHNCIDSFPFATALHRM